MYSVNINIIVGPSPSEAGCGIPEPSLIVSIRLETVVTLVFKLNPGNLRITCQCSRPTALSPSAQCFRTSRQLLDCPLNITTIFSLCFLYKKNACVAVWKLKSGWVRPTISRLLGHTQKYFARGLDILQPQGES
jgi:hypothetical protein